MQSPTGANQLPREAALRSTLSLLAPWSCKAHFVDEVCGLAGEHRGCTRAESGTGSSQGEVGFPGVRAVGPSKDVLDWLVFWVKAEGQASQAEAAWDVVYEATGGDPSAFLRRYSTCHLAIFGFAKGGLVPGNSPVPVFASYWQANGGSSTHLPVRGWLGTEGQANGLADCMGRQTFIPREVSIPLWSEPLRVSLAELAVAYLDHSCSAYRQRAEDQGGKEIGITICKVEDQLGGDTLGNAAITFSYLDWDTHEVLSSEGIELGRLTAVVPEKIRWARRDQLRPLQTVRRKEDISTNRVCYAECFGDAGWQHILATEVARTYLCFPIGEVVTYLLHWLLLRVFASENSVNREFARHWHQWREAYLRTDPASAALFGQVLGSKVTTFTDMGVYGDGVGEIEREFRQHYFAIHDEPIEFERLLRQLDPKGTATLAAESFLNDFFNPGPGRDFRHLPMHRELGWYRFGDRKDKPLRERVFGSISGSPSLVAAAADRGAARSALTAHVNRSVFPIAQVLSQGPMQSEATHYLIFPLAEDTAGQWHRPILFAHLLLKSETEYPDTTRIEAVLRPFGVVLTQFFYSRRQRDHDQRRQELAKQKALASGAYKIGHPMKDRVGPLRSCLESMGEKLADGASAETLQRYLVRSLNLLDRISNLGKLLDLIARGISQEGRGSGVPLPSQARLAQCRSLRRREGHAKL